MRTLCSVSWNLVKLALLASLLVAHVAFGVLAVALAVRAALSTTILDASVVDVAGDALAALLAAASSGMFGSIGGRIADLCAGSGSIGE